jgi:hypothetical protein
LLILLLGIIVPQFCLFGPSLVGSKILLPLDYLQYVNFLPDDRKFANVEVFDNTLGDLVLWAEPGRVRTAEALRHGVFPLTNPYVYCGAPDPLSPKWSLPAYLSALFPSPVTIAWTHLAIALVAGSGMYRLTRGVFAVGFWAACVAAWCYPLTGFFVVWQGYHLDYAAAWFPWMLWAVWKVATTGSVKYWLALIAVTWQPLVRLDVAGHEMIACGLWGAWFLADGRDRFRTCDWWWRAGALTSAWALALALAAPYVLPALEYTAEGVRPQQRAAGAEERPPVGLEAFPQLIVPACDGLKQPTWPWLGNVPVQETGAAGYAGLIATLALFPLAWSARRHRTTLALLIALIVISCSWLLNLAGVVLVLRLPILNSLSHNRFVFVFSACVLMGASVGLDRLFKAEPLSGWALRFALLALGGCAIWSLYRSVAPPGFHQPREYQNVVTQALNRRQDVAAAVKTAEEKLAGVYVKTSALCLAAMGALIVVRVRPKAAAWVGVGLALLQGAELLSFAAIARLQCDGSLYYPQIPGLRDLARDTHSRTLAVGCGDANLLEMYGLRDIRGYDGVDPARVVKLLKTAGESISSPVYALTMKYAPRMRIEGNEIRLPPAMQLLAVRYLIFRQPLDVPGLKPLFAEAGFWVYENPRALPRAFVPGGVRESSDPQSLALLANEQFDPAKVALVTHPLKLPSTICGSARITEESPNRISILAHMETPGLVVLSDLWDSGWQARVNGHVVDVERVDFGVRGVVVQAGDSQIEMTYFPRSLKNGLIVAAVASCLTIIGALVLMRRSRRT